ncbi:hypothetical protein A6R68_11235, partial [Neotoma lepida]
MKRLHPNHCPTGNIGPCFPGCCCWCSWKVTHKDDNASRLPLHKALDCILLSTHPTAKPLNLVLHTVYKLMVFIQTRGDWHSQLQHRFATLLQVTSQVKSVAMHHRALGQGLLEDKCAAMSRTCLSKTFIMALLLVFFSPVLETGGSFHCSIILIHPGHVNASTAHTLGGFTAHTACKFAELKKKI